VKIDRNSLVGFQTYIPSSAIASRQGIYATTHGQGLICKNRRTQDKRQQNQASQDFHKTSFFAKYRKIRNIY
jgi:hypothetical protein